MTTTNNVQEIELTDGRRVCLSYGVIVAAFIPQDCTALSGKEAPGFFGGYVRTDARFSVTTSKHMNQFAGKDAPTVPHETLKALCAPVQSRQ